MTCEKTFARVLDRDLNEFVKREVGPRFERNHPGLEQAQVVRHVGRLGEGGKFASFFGQVLEVLFEFVHRGVVAAGGVFLTRRSGGFGVERGGGKADDHAEHDVAAGVRDVAV